MRAKLDASVERDPAHPAPDHAEIRVPRARGGEVRHRGWVARRAPVRIRAEADRVFAISFWANVPAFAGERVPDPHRIHDPRSNIVVEAKDPLSNDGHLQANACGLFGSIGLIAVVHITES